MNSSAKMTVRLPPGELNFAKQYAKEHGFSLTGLILRYLERLRSAETKSGPSEVAAITGIVHAKSNAREEYIEHLERKHG
ncbi:MAG: hypothetical protein HQK66_14485 [Desulfamplus sp.]|nr:hypothetical protein [Desulfamplus sp.]